MSFDCSRFTFNPRQNYNGVVMQQGRVQLDSDWNEWLAELNRRIQAGTLDILGPAAYPADNPFAFQITATASKLTIGPGRMYVDGILAENHGLKADAVWDPTLAELSGSPQQTPTENPPSTIDFTEQPYWPVATPTPLPTIGSYLFYLDVWTRAVTYLEHSRLVDKAVGVDTTGRLQTIWQVKFRPVPDGTTCASLSGLSKWPPHPSAGRLTTGLVPVTASGPCCLTAGMAYTGMENQLYRVEIHHFGKPSILNRQSGKPSIPPIPKPATFKWSRDNASVATLVTNMTSASVLTVQSLGRDQILGFSKGDWIEITNDHFELNGIPAEIHKIDSIVPSANSITLVDPISDLSPFQSAGVLDPKLHPRIIRWNQSGTVYSTDAQGNLTPYWNLDNPADSFDPGTIPVPPSGTTLLLENGITVTFGLNATTGSFLIGDFWCFDARTADGSVEILTEAPPIGIHHHYAPLSVVNFTGPGQTPSFSDCRNPWTPGDESECGCCSCTVGDGVNSHGKYTKIQDAINSLPNGGEVCILPGLYYENILIERRHDLVIHGCGSQTILASQSLSPVAKPPVQPASQGDPLPATKLSAIISISSSSHIELHSFCLIAAVVDSGIVVDGTGLVYTPPIPSEDERVIDSKNTGVTDITIRDLVIIAQGWPGIFAEDVQLLRVLDNRIGSAAPGLFSAVQASGREIYIERNWIGRLNQNSVPEWIPDTILLAIAKDTPASNPPVTNPLDGITDAQALRYPSGITIPGPSSDIFILENEIDGGVGNGITLGGVRVLDSKGTDTNLILGSLRFKLGPCSSTGSNQIPVTYPDVPGSSIVASGPLHCVNIERNRINDMGLAGIGPFGLFHLAESVEVISISDLTIVGNTITNTLQILLAAPLRQLGFFAYGAICLPYVSTVMIRDNTITNFEKTPDLDVCGIFILGGEFLEISRNHITDTRDLNPKDPIAGKSTGLSRGGIVVAYATPPSFSTPPIVAWGMDLDDPGSKPIFEPDLPALRVEHNVVRVPLGPALFAFGIGPFSIVNNHFACGGTIPDEFETALARTVQIINLGTAVELTASRFSDLDRAGDPIKQENPRYPSCGTVLFTNNICQYEGRYQTKPGAAASIGIFTHDHLLFSSNHSWLHDPNACFKRDAFLVAGTLQATTNRLQESGPNPKTFISLHTGAPVNVTSLNICTFSTQIAPGVSVTTGNIEPIL